MTSQRTSSPILPLEETLLILEESLQQPALDHRVQQKHIIRLKQFYSPLFDFEHSETGSYYYAALQSIKATYLDEDALYSLPLSPLFIDSLLCLIKINMLSLDTRRNKNGITEALLDLAELWGLQHSHDMAELLTSVVGNMRKQVTQLFTREIH